MAELNFILTPKEMMSGLEGSVTGIRIQVKINEAEQIEKGSQLLLKVRLRLGDDPEWYQIVQQVVYSPTEESEEQMIVLKGELWVPKPSNEVDVTESTVDLYYVEKY